MHQELILMLLADARLPVAGHTQSGGLEPALRAGLTDVPSYIATRLNTVTKVEAATAVVAVHSLRQGLALAPVELAWAARTPSPAMRATSRQLARGLLRLGNRLWQLPVLQDPSRGVALGALAFAAGLAPTSLARLIGYDDTQTVAAAALKLVPLDPAEATEWVVRAMPLIQAMASEVSGLTAAGEIPASGAPQIEAWAEAHTTARRRLFSA